MSSTRLKIYNGALRLCEARSIASLSVNEEGRRLLDEVWNDGGVHWCLEQGQWKFAMRAAQLDYDTSVSPDFGLSRAFPKPTDWCITSAVCTDEFYNSPLTQYADEAGYWFADMDTLFVKYVSDDEGYGLDMAKWPQTFADFVQAFFASKICHRMPGGERIIEKICHPRSGELVKAMRVSRSKDAMAGPTTFPARGSWLQSRFGRGAANRRDGGSRTGNLIG